MGTWRLGVLNGFVIPRLFPGDDVWGAAREEHALYGECRLAL